MRELNNHLDSIQGRIDIFNNTVQTMWMNFINADVVKFIVDMGTELIKLVDTLGIIPTLLGAFAGFKIIKSTLSGDTFKGFTESISGAIKAGDLLTTGNQKIAASLIKEGLAVALANSSLVKYAVTSGIVTTAQVANMTTTELLGVAFLALAAKIKEATIAMAKFLFTTPVGWAILAVAAITSVMVAYDKFGPTHENYIEKLEEETENLKSVQSELQSVNEELKTAKARMEELQAKGTLSFVEEEELARLKTQTAELERQEQILLAQEKRARQKQIETALNAVKTDKTLQDGENKVSSSVATTTPYAASQQQNTYATGTSYAAALQNPNFKTQYNQNVVGNQYETALSSLKKAKEDLDKANEEFSKVTYATEEKEYNRLKKNVEEAQSRVNKYNSVIDSMNETWQTEYGEIGYIENATTEVEKQWNEYYRQHQDYLDQQALINNDYGKSTVLDRIFGEKGTDIAQKFKKEFEKAVNAGKDPSEVIENLFANQNYSSAFSGLEEQFGITIDNIKSYFTKTGEFAIDPEFDITKYTKNIKSHSAVISEFQEAIQKLGKGSFTMDDFMDLIERYPDLAKGVDISSNAFYGLSRNLNRAIKTRTKDFVDDLEALRKSLIAAGKSTDSIDQLIEAIENMPSDALDDTIAKYGTLADKIERAKVAQDRLLTSMEENPNEGYETRGEAMDYMKEAMSKGEIGSESNLWNVAKKYGFTYDSAKSINENADALAKFIATRERWFAQDDDGDDRTNDGYSYKGTENFIKDVEQAIQSEEFKRELSKQGYEDVNIAWDYDETTGKLNFDFDNADWDKIVAALSKTEELAGLTSDEFADMMIQVGQYFGIDWSNYDDALDYLDGIANGSSDATTKLKEYGQTMQEYFGEDTNIDLTNRPVVGGKTMREKGWTEFEDDDYATVYSSSYSTEDGSKTVVLTPILPNGEVLSPEELQGYADKLLAGEELEPGVDIKLAEFEGEDSIQKAQEYSDALHEAQEQYQKLQDPLNLETTIATSGLEGLSKIVDLQGSIQTNSRGITVIDSDAFTSALEAAGYTKQQISELIAKVKEYKDVVEITSNDPLGLNNADSSLSTTASALDYLGVQYEATKGTLEEPVEIDIKSKDLITALQENGWTREQIVSYLQNLTSGAGIIIDAKLKPNVEDINQMIEDANATADVVYGIDTTVVDAYEPSNKDADVVYGIDTAAPDAYTPANKHAKIIYSASGEDSVNGTAHANGTAYKGGSWGAPKTETALVGELGPELLVRGNQWTTIGDNGAEFTQIKKGDIIFNHKQTEDLLSNGYVTGRGKMHGGAFAGGTAFPTGSGTFSSYTFSGTGGYTKYDVNNDIVDSFGDAAGALSGAAGAISDAAEETSEEFREVFDWIEVRLEEINEDIDLMSAKLENAIGHAAKNTIVDEMLGANQELYKNLIAASTQYYAQANSLLHKIPAEYHQMIQDGLISVETFVGEVDEKTLEAIQEYRDWIQKAADVTQQAEETLTEMSRLAKEAVDNVATDYDNHASIGEGRIELLEAYNSLAETDLGAESAKVYNAIIEETNENLEILREKRKQMQEEFDKHVELGSIKKYSQDWYDALNDIAAVDSEIVNLIADIENYQDTINELHWEHFDNLMSQYEAISDEASNLIDILGSKDLVDKDTAEWTDEGITALGLYAQQMEVAEMQASKYREEIKYLNKNWEKLGYTEQEYLEKLEELKSGQYDAIKAYNDTKDAIVDLNKERVDAIKEGIEKEIEAYEELIDKKKEELDTEKDLYDFQKGVAEQQKEIADIERKLAALSADNSASARAQRAQLEADLLEAQAELEEQYYDRSITDQQNALDQELENFQNEKDDEIEKLEEYLEETNQVVYDSLATVQANTDIVYQTLKDMGKEYSLSMTEALTSPWQEGVNAIQFFTEKFGLSMSATVEELQKISDAYKDIMAEIEDYGSRVVNQVNTESNASQSAEDRTESAPKIKVGGKINAGSAQIYDHAGDNTGEKQYYSADPIYQVLTVKGDWIQVRHHSLKSGVTGWFKKSQVKAYAKGTQGVDEDQLALIDELGEELVIRPSGGRLTFLEKGSGVVPANLTSNLMEWGKLDPTSMLEQNRPTISALHNTNNETVISIEYGDILHIDNFSGDKPEELSKMIDKAFDKHMKNLNQQIRRYTRG